MVGEKRQKVSDGGSLSLSLQKGTQETKESDKVLNEGGNPGWNSDEDEDIVINSDVKLLDDVDSDARLYALVKAIRAIKFQFLQSCPHFVTVSHVYAYMKDEADVDPTEVDIGLEELKKRHLVTCLYMPGSQDSALVETEDYIQAIRKVAASPSNILESKACEWFEDVVKEYCGPTFPGTAVEQTGCGPSKQYVVFFSTHHLTWH